MIEWTYLLVAALLFVIGAFIKWKKVTWLISGYNTASKEEKAKYDVDKLCHYMSNFVFVLAFIWMMMAGAVWLYPNQVETVTIVGVVVEFIAIAIGIIFMNTQNRVKK